MQKIAQFFRVSEAQLRADWQKCLPERPMPEAIRLPRRATAGSAGYDFFSPVDFTLAAGESILLPTGIRARMDEGWVLTVFPRSGLGFKFRLMLANTVGIIDADYYDAKNEGHILLKLVNANAEGKTLSIAAGDAVAQGIFLPFGITVDDAAEGARVGGLGSTSERRI